MPEFDFEEGYKRLEAAMTTGSDTVPLIAQMHEFSMAAMKARGDVFYSDAETFVRGICTTTRDLGFDTPAFIWDAYNIEAEALGVELVTFEDMAPALSNVVPLIASEADLARLKTHEIRLAYWPRCQTERDRKRLLESVWHNFLDQVIAGPETLEPVHTGLIKVRNGIVTHGPCVWFVRIELSVQIDVGVDGDARQSRLVILSFAVTVPVQPFSSMDRREFYFRRSVTKIQTVDDFARFDDHQMFGASAKR